MPKAQPCFQFAAFIWLHYSQYRPRYCVGAISLCQSQCDDASFGWQRWDFFETRWVGSRTLLNISLKLRAVKLFRSSVCDCQSLSPKVKPTSKLKVMHWPASLCEKNCKRPQQLQRNKFNKFLSACLTCSPLLKKNHNMLFVLLWYACFLFFFVFFFLTVFKDMYSTLHFVSHNGFTDKGRYGNPDFHIQMRSLVFSHRTART